MRTATEGNDRFGTRFAAFLKKQDAALVKQLLVLFDDYFGSLVSTNSFSTNNTHVSGIRRYNARP